MTTDVFAAFAWPWILTAEGRFTKDPADNGNWTGGRRNEGTLKGTKYGISAASYPLLDIENLTHEQAREIYRRDYWDKLRCGEMPLPLGLALFDAAVNHGPGRAARWMQQALHLAADGVVGPATIGATKEAVIEAALPEFLSYRGAHYALQHDEHHIRGWMARLFRLELHCLRLAGVHGAS